MVWGNETNPVAPTSWEIWVDGSLFQTVTVCREYLYDNQWEPGEHKVQIVAISADGKKSDPCEAKTFKVPQDAEKVDPTNPSTLPKPVGLVLDPNTIGPNGTVTVQWNPVLLEGEVPVDGTIDGFRIYLDRELKTDNAKAGCTLTAPSETGDYTVGLVAYKGDSESAPATATLKVTDGTGEGGGGTDPNPGGETETKKPNKPLGLVTGYWDGADVNKGKIKVEWNSEFGDGGTPTSWEVKIDGGIVGTEERVAAYFYENIYDAGTHNVEVVAINSVGRSDPATEQFTLTADQAGSTDGEATDEDIAKLRTLHTSEKAVVDKGNTNYTTATWNAYAEAVEAAGKVIEKYDSAAQSSGTKPTKKEVNKAYQDLVLAKQNLKEKDPEAKTQVVISEQVEQAFVNSKVTLKSVADSPDFTFGTDYTVTINGDSTDTGKVTIVEESGKATIELDDSLFTSAGTYKIQFSKANAEISPVYQVVYATDSTEKWNLKWYDEFDGTSLDKSKWDYQTGNGSAYSVSGWGNDEEQIYTRDGKNASVADGKLTITAKKESSGGYTSARLRTVTEDINPATGLANTGTKLWAAAYGKVEAKIKMPTGEGIWPAFWLLPYDSEYGTWAASGEIDIMEARGRIPNEVAGTIHYGGAWPANASSGATYKFNEHGGGSIDDYHIYTIEWDPTEMRWYVDGNPYSTIKNWYSVESESGNYPYPAPFDEEFYVLLNMAVGGNFDSGATKNEVYEDGVDMDVDYVRWYQRAGGYADWDITQPEPDKDKSETAEQLLQEADESGNFIKDSDFTAMTKSPYTTNGSWKIERGYWAPLLIPENGNGSATWSKKDGEEYLQVNVTNAGSQTYSSQMLQYFPVIKGYSYEISYWAYTDAANQKADVSLKIGGDDDNGWGVYSGNYTDQLTTTPKEYKHSFTMTQATDPTARFEFNLATSTGTVYLSHVSVKILEGGIVEDAGQDEDKEPLSDGNHVYNGGFSNGSDGLLYWHWGTTDEKEVVKSVKEGKERTANITVTDGSVSLWQYGMNLLQTDEYVLTFDIVTAEAQDVTLTVSDKDGTNPYATVTKNNVTSGQVEWTFTQPENQTDTSGKLTLTFTKSAKIDNVKLIRTTYNNVDYDKVDLYPLYNGDFTNGTDGWNIWHEGAGWEVHYINDEGQLELYPVAVGANATFYCVGIQSSSMTLTRGVKYKVDFDYWLDADKTYTLELGNASTQREITLEASKHHYTSDEINGSGTGQFTLYLGPYQATDYKLRLDNIVVAAVLPEKEGYKQPVSLGQAERSVAGSPVVVNYSGTMADDWEKQKMTYFLKGQEIPNDKVAINENSNTLTIDGSLFPEKGIYSFSVKAEGYVATKAINLNILDSSGNLLVNGDFSDGTEGWTFYMADWYDEAGNPAAGGSFSVEDGVAVINHIFDSGESWHFQLSQSLEYPADSYLVEFDAWADVERPIHVQMLTQSGGQPVGSMNSYVNLSTEKKTYKIAWNNAAASDAEDVFNFEFGSMTYENVAAPNDGQNPYNIYLDNIKFAPASKADLESMPAVITVPSGAGRAGVQGITVTYTNANDKWKAAAKTVYVNGAAVAAGNVKESSSSLVIDKAVFAEAGRYSINIVADGFEATNTVYKNMIGEDGNRIFGGDMNDPSQWTVWDMDAGNLSKGQIAGGVYSLDYTKGIYDGYWVNWSSQLKKENISVEAGVPFTLRFEASTDLAGGREIAIEYPDDTPDVWHSQVTVLVEEGGPNVYEMEITPTETTDDFYINFLLGIVGSKLETLEPVPHTLQIDNVTLTGELKVEVKEGLWVEILDKDEIYYTGSAIKPTINVYNGDRLLKEKTDYTVSYKNNTNAGTASVTVKGKGNYTDSDTETFVIRKKDLADEDIVAADVYATITKKGKLTNPGVTVKYGKKTLNKNKDIAVQYPSEEELKNADGYKTGSYTITIVAREGEGYSNNYTGSKTINYDVLPYDIVMMSKVTVKLDKSKITYEDAQNYANRPQITSVKKGSKALTEEDYDIEYADNWNEVGKVAVTLTGKTERGYYGTKKVTYTVTGTALKASNLDIEGIAKSYLYTKDEITVDNLVVKDKKKLTEAGEPTKLNEDVDYTVTYDKNINVGTAKVNIVGMGGYTGKVTKTFKIDKVDLGQIDVADSVYGKDIELTYDETSDYTKNGARSSVTLTYLGNELTEGKKNDFTVSYSNNKKVTPADKETSATVKITGKGNYKGTIKRDFKVTAPDAETLKPEAADIVVPTKLSNLKTTVKVKENSTGKALKAGTDYNKKFTYYLVGQEDKEIELTDLKPDVEIGVKITLGGQYVKAGKDPEVITATFRLYDSAQKAASVFTVDKIKDQTYTGAEIELDETQLVVRDKKIVENGEAKILKRGEDYRVVGYSNNIKKGTAKVTIAGCGNGYGGSKTFTFKIVAKDMKFNFDAMENAITNINQLIFN